MSNIKINDVDQRIQYTATSGQTAFTIPFPFFEDSDIVVYQNDTLLSQGASPGEYGLSGAGNPSGGTMTLVSGATLNDIITIYGDMPIDRTSIYSATLSNLTGSDLNGDFNREVVMMKQIETTQALLQLQYEPYAEVSQDRSVTTDRWLPVLEAEQTWVKNAAGTAIIAADFPEDGAASKISTYVTMTDETTAEPNSYPLSLVSNGILVNDASGTALYGRTITGTASEITIADGDGLSGNPTIGIADNPAIPGTAGMQPPTGTTAERATPISPAVNFRYNTDTGFLEYYDHANTAWSSLPGSSTGTYLELAGGTMAGTIDMDSNTITNLPLPSTSNEPATKGYVDGIAFNTHPACAFGTTANLAGYTYDNGTAGVGATLTAGSNGAFSTDGSSPALNDRILVKDQSTQAQNGIYTLTQVGDGSNPAILTRATDYDEASDMNAGDEVAVVGGTTLAGSKWMMTQTAAITVGTTAITWIDISVPENVMNLTGTQTATGAKTFDDLTLGGDMDGGGFQINDVADPTLAQDVATKNYVDNNIPSGSEIEVNQAGHGFSVSDVLKCTGANTYALAQADSSANAEVAGIVTAVADTDNFTLSIGGQITGLSGLTAGAVYFLDPSTAGDYTATEPTTNGQISKPLFIADTTTTGIWLNMRGIVVGGTNSIIQIVEASFTAATSVTTQIPNDNTIPQNTEGTQVLTATITPTNSSNTLIIEVAFPEVSTSSTFYVAAALFQDSTADSLTTWILNGIRTATTSVTSSFYRYKMAAGTTSSTTFNVRVGSSNAQTAYLNSGVGTRFYGGSEKAFIRIFEVSA